MENGIEKIIDELRPHFEEKQFVSKQQALRNFEVIARKPGESLTTYITRFKTTEAMVKGAGVQQYIDPESRAFKFINTAKIDGRTRNTILGTAGHVWDFNRIVEAIKVLYPGGDVLFEEHKGDNRTLGGGRGGAKGGSRGGSRGGGGGRFQRRPGLAHVAEEEVEEEDPASVQQTEEEGEEVGEGEEQTEEEEVDPREQVFQELSDVLTVTAKKLRAATIGRGWTSKPKAKTQPSKSSAPKPPKGQSRGGSSASSSRSGPQGSGARSSHSHTHRPAGLSQADLDKRAKNACSVCG